ncbi:MAG: hypothetical protein AVDCRST_MAG49-328 [uncultured Thermomicrobiales bacterium]|uniref:Uncharacterized protein n=1 Tax=uncultured Thermomicrobiales bacterium TaxID=1645740 RepID=A0A6J4TY63_9BACT|nr:MAG: hypothetical protein AVDCRST_MAG49-328 [uncultured Thermomicrobiales bacterium]
MRSPVDVAESGRWDVAAAGAPDPRRRVVGDAPVTMVGVPPDGRLSVR